MGARRVLRCGQLPTRGEAEGRVNVSQAEYPDHLRARDLAVAGQGVDAWERAEGWNCKGFDVNTASTDDQEAVALQLVHTFATPGSVVLSCSDGGAGAVNAKNTKITAAQVASLSNVPF